MHRRSFLGALLGLIASPLVAKLPAPIDIIGTGETGTGFWLGIDGATPKFWIGNPSANRLTWDGSTLTLVGEV